ncbi:hypothetical protein PMI16_02132 [Herbaspirillum sp. CF444]|uniref:hypothetical protein n=1 Tax=Herbaspirillum sp. CF444 TaxID=1144319 RepID=UPI00027268C7|nr:hypothetical protein [Herbaspirillum sp. CF444]EJL88984.1 hypothetical protein PMI16_02132 [Herbaspirillum sp. CF444]
MSFPAKETPNRDHAVAMTHDEALRIIEHARKDKFRARELEQLRDKCCLFISEVMNEVNQALAEKEKRTPALLRSKPEPADSAVSLRTEARQREQAAKERRELAEAMVIGALMNSDNPDWNPLDPSTSRNGTGSLLLALLKTALD